MLTIDTSLRKLEIVLTGAPAAELPWVVTYGIQTEDDVSLESNSGVTNGVTAVEVIPIGDDEFQNQLKFFSVKNQNAASVTVIIQFDDNGTDREIIKITLNQNDSLLFNQVQGFYVIDSSGNIKNTFGGLIVEEDDLSPSYTAIRNIQFDKDEFVVSQPAAGVAKINSLGASATDNDARILAWLLGNI